MRQTPIIHDETRSHEGDKEQERVHPSDRIYGATTHHLKFKGSGCLLLRSALGASNCAILLPQKSKALPVMKLSLESKREEIPDKGLTGSQKPSQGCQLNGKRLSKVKGETRNAQGFRDLKRLHGPSVARRHRSPGKIIDKLRTSFRSFHQIEETACTEGTDRARTDACGTILRARRRCSLRGARGLG